MPQNIVTIKKTTNNKQMKTNLLLVLSLLTLATPSEAQRIQQDLGRGVVAVVRNAERSVTSGTEGKLITWRRLSSEGANTVYKVYQNGSLIGEVQNTNIVPQKINNNDVFRVVPVIGGKEDEPLAGEFTYKASQQPYSNAFMKILFEGKICDPDSYDAKYAWPADLDGDGEYDYIVAQISRDHSKTTDKVQAYKSDGTYLWTIDMGRNVRLCGGQNDMVVAYDINCDGKAEVMLRTSEGTRFWDSSAAAFGKYPFGSTVYDIDGDGIEDYTGHATRVPPFYISVVDGMTGAELTSAELDYSKVTDGVDAYGRDKKKNYMGDNDGHEYAYMGGHFCITYTDGIHPSLMMECLDRTTDKKHHNYVFEFRYDWNGASPSNWHHSYTWSRNDKTPWPAEFHQLRVADVDGDGIDELLQGGFGVNPTKGMVFSAGIGHGDRYRVSDIDPTRPGMEVFAIQQSDLMGQLIYDAATGKHLKEWYLPSVTDVGRGECMDVDPDHLGYEVYSTMANLYDCKGEVIKEGDTSYPYEGIWWDGDLAREVANSPGGSGYASNVMITKYNGNRLAEFSQESTWETHAGWAVRPAFWGDILGDWREEIVLLYNPGGRNLGLVGYTTNIPTDYSLYTLQHDPHYRLDCTTRGYYQSPNTSFYLGFEMKQPPLPPVVVSDLRWSDGTEWATGKSGFTAYDFSAQASYSDGKSLLFDISGSNNSVIALNSEVRPSATYFMTPIGHDYTISGTGSIGGTGDVWKSCKGTVTVNANITTTGTVIISEGILNVNGKITGNLELRANGSLGGNTTIEGETTLEGSLHTEGCRLMPQGCITFSKPLTVNNGLVIETAIADNTISKIAVTGKLTVTKPIIFVINADTDDNSKLVGEYTLIETTEGIEATEEMFSVQGLDGQPYHIVVEGNILKLIISESRSASDNVVWTGNSNSVWDYTTANFSVEGTATPFVSGDIITFDDSSESHTVQVDGNMQQQGITIHTDNSYTFNGSGAISGTGDLVKEGKGTLYMNLANNDYTGRTIINEGTLSVPSILDAGQPCTIGNSTNAAANFQINGSRFEYTGTNGSTNHGITLTDSARIRISKANGSLALGGPILASSGILIKEGPGQLSICQTTTNYVKGVVLEQGTIAQGDWRTSFGSAPLVVTGSNTRYKFVASSSMSTIPSFKQAIDVASGAKLTVEGVARAYMQGSAKGSGTIVLNTGGVRFDISTNFSAFEGNLHINGGARLMASLTNMKQLTLSLGDGASLRHYQGGSGTTVAANLQVGALADAAGYSSFTEKPSFGADNESWEVGHNGKDASYSGKLTAAKITKVGIGTWTLKGNESTSPITVQGGTLSIFNVTGATTTGTITIGKGATLAGSGSVTNIVAQTGATINPGINETTAGILKITGNCTMQSGATLLIKAKGSSNSKFKVEGSLTMAGNDTIKIYPIEGRTFEVGDKMTIFTGTKPASGWVIVSSDGSEWDDSMLATDGTLTCTAATNGISTITTSDTDIVDVTTIDGRIVRQNITRGNATDGLPSGIYIIGGKKIVVK